MNKLANNKSSGITWAAYTATAFYTAALCASAGLTQAADPITFSGLNTQVNVSSGPPTGTVQYDITGGTRVETNLFHSFGDFNIPNNTIANFLNETGLKTDNILGRVTGGNASSIFGTIQTTGFGQANLFLMNPAGIVFGPTASLNVGGSVTFTTADYLRLADNGRFSAIPNATTDALLSTAPVAAYGFLGSNPGTITIRGSQFTVSAGHGLSLLGGNLTVQAGTPQHGTAQSAILSAPGGQIHLASVASPGEVSAETLGYAPNINGQSFGTFGTVQISQDSHIDASGDGGGTVLIRGGRFVIEEVSLVSANVTGPASGQLTRPPGKGIDIRVTEDVVIRDEAALEADVKPNVPFGSGGVRVNADRITIEGIKPGPESFTGISSNTDGAGNAGNISLQARGDITFTDVVFIESVSEFNSHATAGSNMPASSNTGNIELISEHGNIQINGGGKAVTRITSQTFGTAGRTGSVTVSAPEGDIVLTRASIFTQSTGLSGGQQGEGHVEISARNLQMNAGLLGIDNFRSLKPGGITVTLSGELRLAGDFSFQDPRSDIYTVSLSSTGAPAGDINITAKDMVVTQGSAINSGSFASGPGGHLKIVADTLQVTDGAQLSSGSTRAPDRGRFLNIVGNTIPTGAGGDITIQALGSKGSVLIDGPKSGVFADTEGTGVGGEINLSARTLTIQNDGSVSASTTGTDSHAVGGSINITAMDQVTLTGGASITARSTGLADAGTISINAGQQLDLTGKSSITTESKQASGGNINLQATDRIRLLDSTLSASVSDGPGGGGNISIDPKLVLLQNSSVLAQADQGTGGRIAIRADSFVADANTVVNADAGRGLNGTVTIQSPTSNLSGTVGQLASKTSPPQVLLQNRCVALAGGEQSTFLLTGRNTLPAEPGGWLNSPISMGHWTRENTEHATSLMVRSQGSPKEKPVLSLRRLTPPGFLVRAFATPSTGCPS